MEVFEQYSLINQKKWTDLLKGLEVGKENTFTFPSVQDIHSFKSIAYKLNTDRLGRVYSIDADKGKKLVKVTVKIV